MTEPRIAIPLGLSPAAFAAREEGAHILSIGGETMGTTWSVKAVAPHAMTADLAGGIEALLAGIIAEMSNWEPDSAISRFNNAPAGSWHVLPPAFFQVLNAGLDVARQSGGAFDPTIGALVAHWGFGPPVSGDKRLPHQAGSGWRRLSIDPHAQRALQPGGIALDLSGIAKGFAVDRIADFLRRRGIRNFLAEIGGELVGEGIRPDGEPWWVDVEAPPGLAVPPIRIALHGMGVATSGDYRRFFEDDGRRRAHSIDPRTKAPIDNDVASVTIMHESCMLADAYATAVTVLGPDEGMALAETHGLAAHILWRAADGVQERFSPAFFKMLD